MSLIYFLYIVYLDLLSCMHLGCFSFVCFSFNCGFQLYANSEIQSSANGLPLLLLSIILADPWETEAHFNRVKRLCRSVVTGRF